MTISRGILSVFALALLAGCAANSASPLAAADEPHALLLELEQGEITEGRYRAELVRVDGRAVVPGDRRAYRIEPGEHVLSFVLDVAALEKYQRDTLRSQHRPSAQAARVMEEKISVTVTAGEIYKFGAKVEGFNYAGWRPFVEQEKD